MNEKQFFEYVGKKLGLTGLVKGKQPNPSRYTKYDKVLDKSQVKRHELVGDKYHPEIGEFPNPETDGGLIPLILTGTPQDLAIETVATGVGETTGSGTAGSVGGLITSLATGKLPKNSSQKSIMDDLLGIEKRVKALQGKNIKAENKTLSYTKDNYYDDGYGNNTVLNNYLDYSSGYKVTTPKNKKYVAGETSNERIARILNNSPNEVPTAFQLPEKGLPKLNPDNTITGLDPADVDNALLEKYGDKAVDFFHEGKTYKNFEDGMGYMRGKENLSSTELAGPPTRYFGRTNVQHIDRDRKNPLHSDMFVTMNNLGEAEELAREWVSMNPRERALLFQSTPGGVSILDVGQEGARSVKGQTSLIDFLNFGKHQQADPAYLNFTVDKYSRDVNDWYNNLPSKLQSINPEIAHFLSKELKRDPKPEFVKDAWKGFRMGKNPYQTTDFNAWTKTPKSVAQSVPFYSDIRLTAKPERLLNYQNPKPFTTSGNTPAYTREPLFKIGSDEATNLHALNSVLGDRGLMDYVRQGRYIQGLQSKVRPEWGKGFGDTSHLQSLSNELSPLGQAQMREYLKLGLIGPAVYDNIMQNEQQE